MVPVLEGQYAFCLYDAKQVGAWPAALYKDCSLACMARAGASAGGSSWS